MAREPRRSTRLDQPREVRRARPEMPILMITGFADLAADVGADVARLPKPFRQSELARAILKVAIDVPGLVEGPST